MFMQPCVFLSDRSHIKKFTPNNNLYIKKRQTPQYQASDVFYLFQSNMQPTQGISMPYKNHLNSTLNPATE